jgi:pimeloyl-ACP methyl ester carboxylesterase
MHITLSPAAGRRRGLGVLVAVVATLALAASTAAAQPATTHAAAGAAAAKPTVVLVHGAFADASGWAGVIGRLQRLGYPVVAPANPLRGVAADAAYLKTFLSSIKGPIILVGHSYGGMVVTNAATGNANVKALVYVAAYAPDEGDTAASLSALAKGGQIGPATLDFTAYPLSDGTTALEGTIKTSVFRKIFAADLPAAQAATMAVAQRPAAAAALGEPSGPPAWKAIPAYYEVAGKDLAIGTAAEKIMAKRIGAKKTITVKNASHVVFISQPKATTDLIVSAARAEG